jgi:hypothetical protein
MSNNTTPETARHEPFLNDGSIPADGVHDGVDVTGGGTSMQPEFATTHSNRACKKSTSILVMIKQFCTCCQLDLLSTTMNLFFSLNRSHCQPFKEHTPSTQELPSCQSSRLSNDFFEYEVGPTTKELDAKSNDGVA